MGSGGFVLCVYLPRLHLLAYCVLHAEPLCILDSGFDSGRKGT